MNILNSKEHANKSDKTIDGFLKSLAAKGLNKIGSEVNTLLNLAKHACAGCVLRMSQVTELSAFGKKYLFENSSKNRFRISTKVLFQTESVSAFSIRILIRFREFNYYD